MWKAEAERGPCPGTELPVALRADPQASAPVAWHKGLTGSAPEQWKHFDHTLVCLPLEGLTISKRPWLAEAKSGRLADTQVFSHQTASSYPGESAPGTRVFTYSIFTK